MALRERRSGDDGSVLDPRNRDAAKQAEMAVVIGSEVDAVSRRGRDGLELLVVKPAQRAAVGSSVAQVA